jgi:hypothetical protein
VISHYINVHVPQLTYLLSSGQLRWFQVYSIKLSRKILSQFYTNFAGHRKRGIIFQIIIWGKHNPKTKAKKFCLFACFPPSELLRNYSTGGYLQGELSSAFPDGLKARQCLPVSSCADAEFRCLPQPIFASWFQGLLLTGQMTLKARNSLLVLACYEKISEQWLLSTNMHCLLHGCKAVKTMEFSWTG